MPKLALPNQQICQTLISPLPISRIGPIDEISLPGLGSFSLMPHDNYSAGINANQILYDFGKTEKNILLEKQGKELSTQSIEQVKQKLSQAAIGNYFSLVYLQEAVKIKEEQLNTLNEHLRYIQKKVETGSATCLLYTSPSPR